MDYSERLYRVIEQVQISLDEHSSTGDPSMVTPEKWERQSVKESTLATQ